MLYSFIMRGKTEVENNLYRLQCTKEYLAVDLERHVAQANSLSSAEQMLRISTCDGTQRSLKAYPCRLYDLSYPIVHSAVRK